MSDLGDRADDYERRLERAGGTDPLMAGMARSVRRTKRVAVMAVAGLVLDFALTIVLGVVAHNANLTDNQLRDGFIDACQHSNNNVTAINTFVDLLIENTQKNSSFFTDEERRIRIAGYRTLKVDLIDCGKAGSS